MLQTGARVDEGGVSGFSCLWYGEKVMSQPRHNQVFKIHLVLVALGVHDFPGNRGGGRSWWNVSSCGHYLVGSLELVVV